MFKNRFDNFVNTSNRENIISCCQTKNVTSFWLLEIKKNRVASNSQLQKGALGRNKVIGYSKIIEEVIEKNEDVKNSKKEEEIEGINKDMSKVIFLDQEIIKWN